jgi:hypothetical protein
MKKKAKQDQKKKPFDLDAIIYERIAQANNSILGKFLNSLAHRIGGVSILAFMNILCTTVVGIVVCYPLYLVGGFYAAILPALFTLLVLTGLFIAILDYRIKFFGRNPPKMLLLFSIAFSLPFGILSLPLLHALNLRCAPEKKTAK